MNERERGIIRVKYDECCILMQALDFMMRGFPQMRKWDTFTNLRERIYNEQLSLDNEREQMGT